MVIVGAIVGLVVIATVSSGSADVGPPRPARSACMGLAEGQACTIDDKAGTCRGPHPSRLTCQPERPSSEGSGSAVGGTGSGSAAGSATTDPASANPEPATPPGHKRGCAVASPDTAAPVGLALAALAVRRRRRSRSTAGAGPAASPDGGAVPSMP